MRKFLASESNIFRDIVEQASEFSIMLLDEEGQIVLWNAGARAIFGYAADEVIGRHFSLLFIPPDRERGRPADELERARREGRAEDTRWHLHKSGRWIFVDGVNMPLRRDDGTIFGFTKISRDVTERQRTERRLAAQLALTNILSEDAPSELIARRVMQTICENLGWDIGALWEIDTDVMRCIDHWRAPHVDAAGARNLCDPHVRMPRAMGLVGEVWESGKATWIPNLEERSGLPRAEQAARAGIRSAFAFPILARGKVSGVMEFFSATEREPEQALLPIMTLIGAQIGDYFERRKTQEALRLSEERYRVVSDAAPDAIFTIDEASVITFCNPAVKQMFGYEPSELIGQPLETIIPERLREEHRRGIERYLRTRKRHITWNGVELPALHRDGHEFACEISFGEWRSDGHTIFTGFARDVTERNATLEHERQARAEAEAARAQLERRAEEEASFRHLASALTGAVEMTEVLYEITNRATHVTRADGVYVERIVMIGHTKLVEVVSAAGRGTPPRGLRVAFPGSMTEEIVEGGAPVILADINRFGRSMAPYLADTCANCEVLVTPLIAEKETLGALVLLNSATSGRHFGEGDIVRARTLGDLASLALRRVHLLEDEREAKEKAEAAVRVRDETLGIVSHDLRNPLTKIALSADLLAEATREEQPELVANIRNSARQMQRLIQDLLDVARLEAKRFTIQASAVDALAILREVCDSHANIAQQKQQTIVCQAPPSLPPICADRDRLAQVFGNLLGNAIKFTPERGTITVEAHDTGRAVEFVVRDTGPGIPEADLKRVFTPYWQAKKTAHMGAGLGLAIVRGIVDAHGGEVWADNLPSGGAAFTFTIPVA